MSKMQIICPSCAKNGYIEVSEKDIKGTSRGVLAVNIAENRICSHTFIVYVDNNLMIRDYFLVDFQCKLPDVATTEQIEEKEIQGDELIDTEIIKLNLHALLITFILRAIFKKKKIILINEQNDIREQILNFFEYITQGSFDIDLSILSREEYENYQVNVKNSLDFEDKNVIRDIDKIIDPKKLKVERRIVQKFFSETDKKSSLIVFKNEIQKAYDLSKTVADYITNHKEKEKIYSKNILKYLEKLHKIKLSLQYMNFLIEIVKNYFNVSFRLHLSNVSRMW